jgi:ubiquinone/menaquinone biosynthesis C-methylase UbiE
MQAMQTSHWWWRGMRRLYRSALARFWASPDHEFPALCRVIDVGCGFGANIPVLNEFGNVVGVDISLDALRAVSTRPALGLVQAEADALPFRAEVFHVIALLAVVEHAEHDDRVLTESHRVAHPGAIQILLTSAFMLLWSHHDVANNHFRRYRAKQLDSVQCAAGWHLYTTSYVNAFVFPAVVAVRMIQRFTHNKASGADSSYDMGPSPQPLNAILEILLTIETWLITRLRLRLPFGVDVFSITRRLEHKDRE